MLIIYQVKVEWQTKEEKLRPYKKYQHLEALFRTSSHERAQSNSSGRALATPASLADYKLQQALLFPHRALPASVY
jgi:hypothetical protein